VIISFASDTLLQNIVELPKPYLWTNAKFSPGEYQGCALSHSGWMPGYDRSHIPRGALLVEDSDKEFVAYIPKENISYSILPSLLIFFLSYYEDIRVAGVRGTMEGR
jgi:hypothetical protein